MKPLYINQILHSSSVDQFACLRAIIQYKEITILERRNRSIMSLRKVIISISLVFLVQSEVSRALPLPAVPLLSVKKNPETEATNSTEWNYETLSNYVLVLTDDEEQLKESWDPDQKCYELGMELAFVPLVPQNLENIIDNSTIFKCLTNEPDYNITISELTIWVHIRQSFKMNDDQNERKSDVGNEIFNSMKKKTVQKSITKSVCLFDDFDNHCCFDQEKDNIKRNAVLCRTSDPFTLSMTALRMYWKRFWMVTSAGLLGFTIAMLITYLLYQKCTKPSTRDTYGEAILFSK